MSGGGWRRLRLGWGELGISVKEISLRGNDIVCTVARVVLMRIVGQSQGPDLVVNEAHVYRIL